MARTKKTDGVEAVLRTADRTLEQWFKQSRMTSRQATVVFARFLNRAKRGGAGALRHQVDGLQGGLKKLSTGLVKLERGGKSAAKKTSAPTTRSPKRRKNKAA